MCYNNNLDKIYDMEELLGQYITTLKKSSHILRGRLLDNSGGPVLDLKFSQLKAISTFKDDCPLTIKELADNANIKFSNMSRIVNDLILEGFAEREYSVIDRRKVIVRLTPKGIKTRDIFLENRRRSAMSIFSGLTEENKNELLSSLGKACKILEDTIGNAEPISFE